MLATALALAAGLAALPPQAMSPEAWQADVAVARTEFLAKDRSYAPAARGEAVRRLTRLEANVRQLSDQQIVAELAQVAALSENAHTRAYLLRNRGWWRRYPVRIWRFSDGWRVVAVRPGHEALLGGRVVAIGGMPIEAAAAAVRPLYAGVPGWADYMATYSLTSPDALLGTGVIRDSDAAEMEVEKDGRREVATLQPVAEPRRSVPEETWWFLSPQHRAAAGWSHVLESRPLPAYLQLPNEFFEARACQGDLLYVQFFRAADEPGGAFAPFGAQILELIRSEPPTKVVVDLRFNTGGDLQKAAPLLKQIAESEVGRAPGRLFVLVGPTTFSAGMHAAALLRQDSRAILVGDEPGDHLNFWAEGGNVRLPNSGIDMHYADRVHLYSTHPPSVSEPGLVYTTLRVKDLTPDRPAKLSFADYLAGRDPLAEAVEAGGFQCGPAGGGVQASGGS